MPRAPYLRSVCYLLANSLKKGSSSAVTVGSLGSGKNVERAQIAAAGGRKTEAREGADRNRGQEFNRLGPGTLEVSVSGVEGEDGGGKKRRSGSEVKQRPVSPAALSNGTSVPMSVVHRSPAAKRWQEIVTDAELFAALRTDRDGRSWSDYYGATSKCHD